MCLSTDGEALSVFLSVKDTAEHHHLWAYFLTYEKICITSRADLMNIYYMLFLCDCMGRFCIVSIQNPR